jgi:phosphatidate cytidylyltransferase
MIVGALWSAQVGGSFFSIFWFAASVAVLWEWQRLVGGKRLVSRCFVGVLALGLAVMLVRVDLSGAFAALLVAAAASAALAGTGARTWAAGGLVYAGLLILAVISLRFSFPFGDRAIVWLFATVWSTDVLAYFGGRIIGGPKLWPRVSPSKTWSGTITGLAAGAALGTFVALRHLESPHALVPVLLLSVAAAALSQAGDAFESGIKRRFGVKDTSRLIPGHGGLMDRLDGFIAAAIFAFLIGLVRGLPSVAGGLFYWA